MHRKRCPVRVTHNWPLKVGGGGRRACLFDRSECGWRQRTQASLTPIPQNLGCMQHICMLLLCLQAKRYMLEGQKQHQLKKTMTFNTLIVMKLDIENGIRFHPPVQAQHIADAWFIFVLPLQYIFFPRVFYNIFHLCPLYTLNHMTYCK